jgi:starch synthase
MKILMSSAEGPPMQRTGALVDVIGALPGALRDLGHEISVALPFYREIRENRAFKTKDTGITVEVQVGDATHVARYLEGRSASGVQLFFIRCDEFFDRVGIYGEHGKPYDDNAARFIFFSKAIVELARRLTPQLEVLHVHDWPPALIPVFVHAHGLPFTTVLTIHHVADQGSFWGLDFDLTNLPERFFTLQGVEFFGRLNFLKGGILYADRITTVSEHYRREILTPSGGCGLDAVLRENAYRLSAILDGVDYSRWNPASDRFLPARYDARRLNGKSICREALLKQMKLAPEPGGPVFGMVTRVVQEKGFEILVPLLDRLLWDDVRLIILGEGDPAFETALAVTARKFPTRFAYQKDYDKKVAHLIQAGMDISLIPSRFEPAGLGAMYNLKYGALPSACVTGGIQEIIEDYDPNTDSGYGFLCYEYSSDAFWDAVIRARQIFRDRSLWTNLMKRAMARNFSWEASARRYEALYADAMGAPDKAVA